jgi:glycosyltransferase involved in cell wall biosynthesis
MTGVAIVIPMLNEAAGLPRLLRSLAALEPPPTEVLAVDGGSTDASVAIAEAAGLLVVRHETRGRAAAINRGVQEATAPIICVLHADTLLPDDAVAVMRRVLADPGTALAGFTPLLSGPDQVRWGTSFHNWIKTWYAPLLFRPQLFLRGVRLLFGDHAMFFRRADFLTVGGCDPTLLVMEEADLCVRFHRPYPPRQPRGDHLRSPGHRLGRTAGELDLPQGRSTLGARLSQRAGAALPRRTLIAWPNRDGEVSLAHKSALAFLTSSKAAFSAARSASL